MATGKMLLACLLIVGCAVILPADAKGGRRLGSYRRRATTDSCMSKLFVRAGVPRYQALAIQRRAVRVRGWSSKIARTSARSLRYVLHASYANTARIKSCLAGKSRRCHGYNPCYNGGRCQLGPSTTFVCMCQTRFSGPYCQTATTNGGNFRKLQRAVWALRRKSVKLGRKVSSLERKQAVSASSIRRLSRCSPAYLGYKYTSQYHKGDAKVSGTLLRMSFRKRQYSTILRVSFSTSVRNSAGGARWFIRVDGRDCSNPSKIGYSRYQKGTQDNHTPIVIKGVCRATSAGTIRQGRHTITVHVEHIPGWKGKWHYAGWQSTKLLEVREICT